MQFYDSLDDKTRNNLTDLLEYPDFVTLDKERVVFVKESGRDDAFNMVMFLA